MQTSIVLKMYNACVGWTLPMNAPILNAIYIYAGVHKATATSENASILVVTKLSKK